MNADIQVGEADDIMMMVMKMKMDSYSDDAWRWLSLPHARAAPHSLPGAPKQLLPTGTTLPGKVTSTIMASNFEQSIFFQQRRAKDELIVRGQYNVTAAGAPLTHIPRSAQVRPRVVYSQLRWYVCVFAY